jgi:glucose/mannose-6-phosphate isomerase
VLDDLKMIHERDAQDALGAAERQWHQPAPALDAVVGRPVGQVLFMGTAGSALAANIVRTWLRPAVPFVIAEDYELPAFAGPQSLCLVAGQGSTVDEAYNQAAEQGLPCVRMAAADRTASVYGAVLEITAALEAHGLAYGALAELETAGRWLGGQAAAWRPDVPTARNPAKQTALELAGKSVVVSAGSKLWPAAGCWKLALNCYAKQVAWCGRVWDEAEFAGWTKQPVHKPYALVDLRSPLEALSVQRSFEASERLLSGLRPAPLVIKPAGETLLQQLLYCAALGEFTALYTALLSNLNPSASEAIDKLNKELA